MKSLRNRSGRTQEVLNKITVDPTTDLARWEGTDPSEWPAEWADQPIALMPTGKGRQSVTTPRKPSRRQFLALAGVAASGAGCVGLGLAVAAGSAPGPLVRKLRRLQQALDRQHRAFAKDDPDPSGTLSPVNKAFESWKSGIMRAAEQAERDLIDAVVAATGYQPQPIIYERFIDPMAFASIREGGWLFLVVAGREKPMDQQCADLNLIDFYPAVTVIQLEEGKP